MLRKRWNVKMYDLIYRTSSDSYHGMTFHDINHFIIRAIKNKSFCLGESNIHFFQKEIFDDPSF